MKIITCILTLIGLSAMANASTIYIGSDAFTTTDDSGQPTVDLEGALHPNPGWRAAFAGTDWISYGPTGDPDDPGFFTPALGTIVTFTTRFTLTGTITGAHLKVLADDSASVVLNGHMLIVANTLAGVMCSNVPVGCLASTEGVLDFAQLAPYLVDGMNTLSFVAVQVAGASFGVDFKGHVTTSETPEPTTFGAIGGALAAWAILRRLK